MQNCTQCHTRMHEGYVIDAGLEYYCSDSCLYQHYSELEYLELYTNDDSASYWTTWED